MAKWSKVAQFSANALALALTANTAVQLDIMREIAMRSRVLVDSVGFDYGMRYFRLTDILVLGLAGSLFSLPLCVYVLGNFGFRMTAVIGHLMHTLGFMGYFKGRDLMSNTLGAGLLGLSTSLIFNGHSMMSKLVPYRHELVVQHFQTLMSTLSLITPVLLFFLGEYRSRLVGYDVYNSVILGYIGFLYLLTPLVFFTAKGHTYPQTQEWDAEETSSDLSDGAGSSNETPENENQREPAPYQPFVLLSSSLPRVSESLPMVPLQGFETATKNWRNQVRSLPFLICALYMFNVNFRRAYFLANFREICFDFVKDPAEAHSLQMFYNYISVIGFLGTLAWAFLVEQSVQMMLWFSTSLGILIQLSLCFASPVALRVAAVLFAFYNTNIYVEIYYVITELFGQTSSNFLQGLMFTAGGLGACCVLLWNRVVSVYFEENWAVQNGLMLLMALFSLSLPAYRLLQDRAEAKKQNPERKASYV